jgi:predicted thioesterase
VRALDEDGAEIAVGEMHRRVVDSDRFMARFTEATPRPAD